MLNPKSVQFSYKMLCMEVNSMLNCSSFVVFQDLGATLLSGGSVYLWILLILVYILTWQTCSGMMRSVKVVLVVEGKEVGVVGIWSHERHYQELASQTLAKCMICTVVRNMDCVFLLHLCCMHGWWVVEGGKGGGKGGGGWGYDFGTCDDGLNWKEPPFDFGRALFLAGWPAIRRGGAWG